MLAGRPLAVGMARCGAFLGGFLASARRAGSISPAGSPAGSPAVGWTTLAATGELARAWSAPRFLPRGEAAGAGAAFTSASWVRTSWASEAKSRAPIDSGAYSKIVLPKLGDSASFTLVLIGVRKTWAGK